MGVSVREEVDGCGWMVEGNFEIRRSLFDILLF